MNNPYEHGKPSLVSSVKYINKTVEKSDKMLDNIIVKMWCWLMKKV